jgi:hypothetical protein
MGLFTQILLFMAGAITIGFVLWLSLWLFIALFFLGIGWVAVYALRSFLLERDILNPHPGIPLEEPAEQGHVIEGDFERIEPETKE